MEGTRPATSTATRLAAAADRLLGSLGDPPLRAARDAVRIAALVGHGVTGVGRAVRRPGALDVIIKQILFTGVEAVPFAALLAVVAGFAIAVQSEVLGIRGTAGEFLVALVVREVGPLAAATIVVARSATAIAAEMGWMRVAREVDALEGMGIDPYDYLVLPRLAGAAVALAGLSAFVVAGTLFAAAGLAAARGGASTVLAQVVHTLGARDLLALAGKTIVPGAVIAAIACDEGLAARAATDIPPAVSRTAVRSIATVVVWDAVVTGVLFVL